MKKILFLSPLPPPYYGSAISSEMCLDILKNTKDIEVRNIKLNYSKEMSDVGKIDLGKIKGSFEVKKEIGKQIRKFNPEIVYFIPATSGFALIRDFLFAEEIKKSYKKKILFHIRSRTTRNSFNDILYKKMFLNQKAIVLGESLVSDISPWIKKDDISILPNAVKNVISDYQLKSIISHRKKNEFLNILFLSNMDETKGWPKLLEACKILKRKGFSFRCDFVGAWQSKEDEKDFCDFVKKNDLEKIVFAHGRKTGKEKNTFLAKANVLVFPTEYKFETFGRVILEAYMFAVPVIANKIATISDTIQDKKTGFILEKNDAEEIARYLKEIHNNKNLSEIMGKTGRQRFLSEYELDKYRKKFRELFYSQAPGVVAD